jgi:hypothetical protein
VAQDLTAADLGFRCFSSRTGRRRSGRPSLSPRARRPRVAGNSTSNCNAATPRDSHAGGPRGIANDRMTAAVEMAGASTGSPPRPADAQLIVMVNSFSLKAP